MGTLVDLDTWPKAEQFAFFKTFDRPHYAITTRIDVTRLMSRKSAGLSVFRSCLWAIGAGLFAVPELRMRFVDDQVTLYDSLTLSPTIALENGDFRYTYLTWTNNRADFDISAKDKIASVRDGQPLNANDGSVKDVAYLSCLPWLDYTSLDNALPGPQDCVPRVSWGKIVSKSDGFDMAMTLQVHHALVDGRSVGSYFEATQTALDEI